MPRSEVVTNVSLPLATADLLRRINEVIAVAAGLLLLASVIVTVYDVFARPFAASVGGTDELAGYAMAIASGWGMSYALTQRAHVRIGLLRTRCPPLGRAVLDLIAISALSLVALLIAIRAWPVLARSIQNQSTANTTLETPLWIPQSLWISGWIWFALSSLVLLACSVILLIRGRLDAADELTGLTEDA